MLAILRYIGACLLLKVNDACKLSSYSIHSYNNNGCSWLIINCLYVTRSAKSRHNCAFCILRNTNFKYSRCCNYLMPQSMNVRVWFYS